jgi:hypothetical protein
MAAVAVVTAMAVVSAVAVVTAVTMVSVVTAVTVVLCRGRAGGYEETDRQDRGSDEILHG